MYRKYLIWSALGAALAGFELPGSSQNVFEIIPLRHRPAGEVAASLRPLLQPGGTLTAHGNELIVRTSPENLEDLRRALEAIDRPLRRLQISVRFDEALDAARQRIEVSGQASNRSARIDVLAQEGRTRAAGRIEQRIQVLEGARAFIATGQSTPIHEDATGFEAVARLAGDSVLLEVAPRRASLDRRQFLATTVSARLGEWFEVGGAAEGAESRRVWLKVEEVRP